MKGAAGGENGNVHALRLKEGDRESVRLLAASLDDAECWADVTTSAVIRACIRYAAVRRKEFVRWAAADPEFYLEAE